MQAGIAVVSCLALATLFVHVLADGNYGYFRDELYFLACGRHLDWGYVDQPPLIAAIAAFSRWLLGDSLRAIRFFPALAGAGKVLLTGLITRELGGKRFAQVLASVAVITAPIYLGIDHLLTMNAFDPLFWMGCVYVAILIFKGGSPRLWLVFGAVAGLGLENKYSMLFFGFAFVVGLVLTSRRTVLLDKWLWLGGLVAFLVYLPNFVWEVRHHWPMFEILNNVQHSGKNTPISLTSFFSAQLLILDPLSFPLWLVGLGWVFFDKYGKSFRFLGWAFVALFATFVVLQGKMYYLAPAYPMLFAAGGVAAEAWIERRNVAWLRTVTIGILIAGGAVLAPFAIPVLPVETYIAYQKALHLEPPRTEQHKMGPLPQGYADMFGWPEMTAKVAEVYDKLTPEEKSKCGIFAQNYGEAGAVDFFGPQYHLPPALSGHNNYFLWGPRGYSGDVMIVMGDRRENLEQYFDRVELGAVFQHPYVMPYENDLPIWICRGIKIPFEHLWPRVKLYI
ncbi:MAG TPA: glycosyltransferase family 39 protein [Terriglobia bacterium]|nr:glycosyltransferase family 39 protein [Terriglobia bacterium]